MHKKLKLTFCLLRQKQSQQVYKPVNVGFLYTNVRNLEVFLQTKTSRKGKEELIFFI